MKTAYIDGDVLKYLAGFACQKTIYTHLPTGDWFTGKTAANDWMKEQGLNPRVDWVDEEWKSELELEPFKNCKFILDTKIEEVLHETKSEKAVICLTPSHTFRHDVAFTRVYKGNRKDSPKPEYAEEIIKYFEKAYDVALVEGLEADDIMGMNATGNVIATNDKDLNMVPGEHYNFSTSDHFFVGDQEADEWFYIQLLAGDTTDNIVGIPGLGMAKAKKIVEEYTMDYLEGWAEDLVAVISAHYEEQYEDWRDVMEEHAKLIYILRPGDTPDSDGWRKLLYASEAT